MYTGGILNDPGCLQQVNHAVTAVGYGVENGQKYYIIRNSWGAAWGDRGYINIAYSETGAGICGITQYSSVYPVVKWKAKKKLQ